MIYFLIISVFAKRRIRYEPQLISKYVNNTDLDGLLPEHCELLLQIVPQEKEVRVHIWKYIMFVCECIYVCVHMSTSCVFVCECVFVRMQICVCVCVVFHYNLHTIPFFLNVFYYSFIIYNIKMEELAKNANHFKEFGEAELYLYQVCTYIYVHQQVIVM